MSEVEVAFIRELIAGHPGASRRALSLELCAAWDWVQANGHPRDMVCRGLLLALHRAGHITLPPPRRKLQGPPPRPRTPARPGSRAHRWRERWASWGRSSSGRCDARTMRG